MGEPGTVELVGIEQAARELGVSPSLLRLRDRLGALPPAMRVGGQRARVYSRRDLDLMRRVLATRPDRRRRDRRHSKTPERAGQRICSGVSPKG